MIFPNMYWARYVLMDQALRGGGMRSLPRALLVDNENLLELGTCEYKEMVADVKFGQNLTCAPSEELRSLVIEYQNVFKDFPGTTT